MSRKLTKTWYNSFVDATLPHTEAPRSYLEWAAFSVLGGVLKNHVFIKDGLYTVYPNQYIILTGPPAIGKGTAINFAWGLIKDSKLSFPLANTISDRATPEGIIKVLEQGWPLPATVGTNGAVVSNLRERTCTLFSAELRVLLTSSDWMLDFLCGSWDQGTYEYTTKNQGIYLLKNLCTSLIGATVPDFVRGMDKEIDMTVAGGFSSRCIYVFEDKKSKDLPFAQPLSNNTKSSDLYAKLKDDLEHIAKTMRGEYVLNADAKIAFSNFYPSIAPLPDDSDAMLNFKGRMKTHIFKTAMILAAGRKDQLVIDGLDMRTAIQLIVGVQRKLDRVFRGMGESRLAESTARVLLCIEKQSMVSRRTLMQQLHRHMVPDDLDKILYLLEGIGDIQQTKIGSTIYYSANKQKIPNPTGAAKP